MFRHWEAVPSCAHWTSFLNMRGSSETQAASQRSSVQAFRLDIRHKRAALRSPARPFCDESPTSLTPCICLQATKLSFCQLASHGIGVPRSAQIAPDLDGPQSGNRSDEKQMSSLALDARPVGPNLLRVHRECRSCQNLYLTCIEIVSTIQGRIRHDLRQPSLFSNNRCLNC